MSCQKLLEEIVSEFGTHEFSLENITDMLLQCVHNVPTKWELTKQLDLIPGLERIPGKNGHAYYRIVST